MPPTFANFMRHIAVLPVALALCTPTLHGTARAQNSAEAVAADLRMAQESAPLRRVADAFIERAMAGDANGTQALLSRTLVQRTGEANIQRALQHQIVPFFAQGGTLGRSVTVARTTDASGAQGFAFYMWLQPARGGDKRPFTVYAVVEDGRAVVANVVPDRLVPGRHS